jgi:hypothetical protein
MQHFYHSDIVLRTPLRKYVAVFSATWLLAPSYTTSTVSKSGDNLLDHSCTVASYHQYVLHSHIRQGEAPKQDTSRSPTTGNDRKSTETRTRSLAKMLLVVTVLSLMTWLPYLIVRILLPLKVVFQDLVHQHPVIFTVVYIFQCSNSLINPVIYVFRMKDFRKGFFYLMFKCSRDQQEINPIGYHGNLQRQPEPALELDGRYPRD